MTSINDAKRKTAHRMLVAALNEHPGVFDQKESPYRIGLMHANEYHSNLTRKQIDNGIQAFCLLNNIWGSDGDCDLYGLLHAYLLDVDKRQRINHIVREL